MMEDVLVLSEDVGEFDTPEETTPMRPQWPMQGAPCPVTQCNNHIFRTYSAFNKHWTKCHKFKEAPLYKCATCGKMCTCLRNVQNHIKSSHKTAKTPPWSIENRLSKHYIDPQGALPYRPANMLRDIAKQRREAMREEQTGEILQKGETTARDEEIVWQDGKIYAKNINTHELREL